MARSFKRLVLELAKRESKKRQVNIAQLTETVSHLADIVYEEFDAAHIESFAALLTVGRKRKLKEMKRK